jgi:hypothetical protein
MQNPWKAFLVRPNDVLRSKPIRTCDWVETLLHFGVLPELNRQGYNLIVDQQTLATCVLNHLYRHEQDAAHCKFTLYKCSHESCCQRYPEEYERFCELLPESTWSAFRKSCQVADFADESWFADRIWNAIPDIVFAHVCLDTSPANIELWTDLNPDEDEDSATE